MLKLPLVYVAGPLTKPDPLANTHRAMKFWAKLMDTKKVVAFCPHWSVYQEIFEPRPYEAWMEYDFHVLQRCEVLFRLEGASSGADREVKFMQEEGKPVFYEHQYEAFMEWVENWIAENNKK